MLMDDKVQIDNKRRVEAGGETVRLDADAWLSPGSAAYDFRSKCPLPDPLKRASEPFLKDSLLR